MDPQAAASLLLLAAGNTTASAAASQVPSQAARTQSNSLPAEVSVAGARTAAFQQTHSPTQDPSGALTAATATTAPARAIVTAADASLLHAAPVAQTILAPLLPTPISADVSASRTVAASDIAPLSAAAEATTEADAGGHAAANTETVVEAGREADEEAGNGAVSEAVREAINQVGAEAANAGHSAATEQPPSPAQTRTPGKAHTDITPAAQTTLTLLTQSAEVATAGLSEPAFATAQSGDLSLHRLDREASIAQVLASLNQLPIHSNASQLHFLSPIVPSQPASPAQLSRASMSPDPRPGSKLQLRPDSTSAQAQATREVSPVSTRGRAQAAEHHSDSSLGPLQHAEAELSEQHEASHATQPMSSASLRPSLKALSPVTLSHSPQRLSPGSKSQAFQQVSSGILSQVPQFPSALSFVSDPQQAHAEVGKLPGLAAASPAKTRVLGAGSGSLTSAAPEAGSSMEFAFQDGLARQATPGESCSWQ